MGIMKRIVTVTAAAPVLLVCALLVCASWLLPACHNDSSNGQREHGAVIVGTVVDAATGKSVADVTVEGPGGRKTRSDDSGRFRLEGLEIGATGEVKATASDGRTASVPLRRLSDKKLEVVLYLKRP
jgi:hypothetical protein